MIIQSQSTFAEVYLYFDITNLNVLCVSVCVSLTWMLYIYVLGM